MTYTTAISQGAAITVMEETVQMSKYRGIGRKRAALARSYAAAMAMGAAA